MSALARFIASDHLVTYGWALPSVVFIGMTLLCHALLAVTPRGERAPWLARIHPMYFMLHPQRDPEVVNKPTTGVLLAWLFIAAVPGGSLLLAGLYTVLMLTPPRTRPGAPPPAASH